MLAVVGLLACARLTFHPEAEKGALLEVTRGAEKVQAVTRTEKVQEAKEFLPRDDVALILTTYNTPDRSAMYFDTVKWWLDNHPDLASPLYVVDSANRGFPHLEKTYGQSKLRVLKYNQTKEAAARNYTCCKRLVSLERLELELALEKAPELHKRRLLTKLTGKYRVPGLANELHTVPKDVSIVVQDHKKKEGPADQESHPSELYSMSPEKLAAFVKSIPKAPMQGTLMENYFARWLQEQKNVHHLPQLAIPAEFRVARTDGKKLDHL